MIIDKKILGVADVASKDPVRPTLSCVRIEKGKAIATDRYCLMIIDLPKDVDKDSLPELEAKQYKPIDNVNIKAQDLIVIGRQIKPNRNIPALGKAWTVEHENESEIKIVTTDLDSVRSIITHPDLGDYPKYEKVMGDAKAKPVKATVTVNPAKLSALLAAMVKAGVNKDYGQVTLTIGEPLDAVLVSAKDGDSEIEGLLMPIRKSE